MDYERRKLDKIIKWIRFSRSMGQNKVVLDGQPLTIRQRNYLERLFGCQITECYDYRTVNTGGAAVSSGGWKHIVSNGSKKTVIKW